MAPLKHPEEYYALVLKHSDSAMAKKKGKKPAAYSDEERRQILEFQRINKIFAPQVTMIHGSSLLQNPKRLGDDVWVM